MKHDESLNQIAFVRWFRLQYPQFLMFSIPNGGSLRNGYRQAARMKMEGMTSGIPDLFLAIARLGYYGLFIEMKSKAGKLSVEQKEKHIELAKAGYGVLTCYSFEAAKDSVKDYIESVDTFKFVRDKFMEET